MATEIFDCGKPPESPLFPDGVDMSFGPKKDGKVIEWIPVDEWEEWRKKNCHDNDGPINIERP